MNRHIRSVYGRGTEFGVVNGAEFGVVNGAVFGAVNGAVGCGDRRGQRGQSDGRAVPGEAHQTAFGKRTTFGKCTALGRCTLLVDRRNSTCQPTIRGCIMIKEHRCWKRKSRHISLKVRRLFRGAAFARGVVQ